jgi:chemotaxis response regulator CheB
VSDSHSPTTAHSARHLVVIGGSLGANKPLGLILSQLPPDFPAAIVVVQHGVPDRPALLAPILAKQTRLPVEIADAQSLREGHVYVVPPNFHARITEQRRIRLSDGVKIRHVRSSANPLFETAALAFDGATIAVVLSGTGMDATDGVQAIKRGGGVVIVESPDTALHSGMPRSAVSTGAVDYELSAQEIAATLQRLVRAKPPTDLAE